MIRKTPRTARKTYYCTCGYRILAGERHWEMVAVGEDFMGDGWWRLRECADCAERYGRPIPEVVA